MSSGGIQAFPKDGAGNILFYTPAPGDLIGKLICLYTKSEYCHVAVQRDANTVIEATGKGIVRRMYAARLPAAVFTYESRATDVDPQDFAAAMIWLDGMIGQPYGYSDIMTVISPLKKMFYLVAVKRWICSALAAEWLVKAGGVNLHGFEDDPHTVEPADLATVMQPIPV